MYKFENQDNFSKHLGLEFLEINHEGIIEARMKIKDYFYNHINSVHGGLLFSLADVVAGTKANSYGKKVTTLNSTFNYLAPAINTEYLLAKAKEVKKGRTICVYEVEIFNDDNKLIASGTFTYYVLEKLS